MLNHSRTTLHSPNELHRQILLGLAQQEAMRALRVHRVRFRDALVFLLDQFHHLPKEPCCSGGCNASHCLDPMCPTFDSYVALPTYIRLTLVFHRAGTILFRVLRAMCPLLRKVHASREDRDHQYGCHLQQRACAPISW